MSTKDLLLDEITKAPDPILIEVRHYLKFLEQQAKLDHAVEESPKAESPAQRLARHPAIGSWPVGLGAMSHVDDLRAEWKR